MKFFLKYLFLILSTSLLFCEQYNLFGYVLDSVTQKPLADVSVYIKNQNKLVETDENGYFNYLLVNPELKVFDLKFELIGYDHKPIKINLSKNNKIIKCDGCANSNLDLGSIFLQIKSIQIDLVEIQSNLNKAKQISDISITGLELSENLKGNLASTLANYPNIGINSFGSATSKPSLRGFSGDRFLLTKDGIETGDLSQSSIDHAIALDMSEVSEIEIIRGPKSLLFGPNTIGGVINTTMLGSPRIRVDEFSAKVLLGSEFFSKNGVSLFDQGSYNSLLFYFPMENDQLNISFNNRSYNNQTSPLGILENTELKSSNYKISLTHYNDKNFINVFAEKFRMDYGIPPTTSGHTTGIDIPMYKKTFQINYNENLNHNFFSELDFKYNFIDYKHFEIIPDHPFNDYELLLSKKTHNFKFDIDSDNLSFGSEINIENFISDGINETPVTDEVSFSIYGFYKESMSSDFDFISSFRLGHFSVNPKYYNFISGNPNLILTDESGDPILDENGDFISLVRKRKFENVSFSLGFKKQIDKIEINSWVMHTMRAPRVEELYSDGPHLATYAFEIGNPNLKSEQIYGIENSISFASNPLSFSIVSFYNYSPYYFQMTKNGICEEAWDWNPYSGLGHPCPGVDYIDWGAAPLGWLYIYSPKGIKAVIKGFEFDFEYKLKDLQIDYNLSFVKGDNLTLGLPLSYINPMKEILSFNFNRKLINLKLRFSKIHAQDRLGQFETFTEGAVLTDLLLSYNHESYDFTIQFNNIFNKEYYNHLSRIKSIAPEAGRNVVVVYKMFF